MKDFFKNVLATILGCTIVLTVFSFISIIGFAIVMMASDSTFSLKDNSVLTIKLEGVLSDRTNPNPLYEFLGLNETKELGLDDILSSIDKARENNKVKGIYIDAGMFSAPVASMKEIRDKLVDFKESGKFIISYSDGYTQGSYYLASISDKVMLNPEGRISFEGYSSSPMFYKGLLDKLGIEMQIFKVGTFKSAVEPFIEEKMSEANKEQVTSYIKDMWSTVLNEVSVSRNISVDNLITFADSFPALMESSAYIDAKIVDTLIYRTDIKEYIQNLLEVKNKKDVNYVSIDNMVTVPYVSSSKSKNIIAVLYAEGEIQSVGTDGIVDYKVIKELQKLKDNEDIKAVVFRVNSPGGSAYASEQIWKAVTDLKEVKPVIVSMGSMAASGGYYISCNASAIFAQPNTLTGSIGIFGMFPNASGLTNKLGLSFDNVKTNTFSDFGDITRPMREDEKKYLQNYVEKGYELFLTRCSEGRNIPKDSLDLIAQGRVWTGNQALAIGLIDKLGGIDDAIEEAVKLSELDSYSLKSYPQKKDFFQSMFSDYKEDVVTQTMKEYLGSNYESIKLMKEIESKDFMQTRIPYNFPVY